MERTGILAIWENEVKRGYAVYISTDSGFVEGVIEEINFECGYATIKTATGISYVKLIEAIYIQRISRNNSKCKNPKNVKNARCVQCTQDITANIWSNVSPGARVHVNIRGQSNRFSAVVEEVNLDLRYVGFRTISRVTYVPLDNIISVNVHDCDD